MFIFQRYYFKFHTFILILAIIFTAFNWLNLANASEANVQLLPPQVNSVAVSQAQINSAVLKLDKIAETVMNKTKIPGLAIAVVQKNKILYAKGFGVRNINTSDPVDANTVFLLASVSKSIGATVLAKQISLGKINWNEKIHRLLPNFKLEDEWRSKHVTIADLYSHRSGLPDHGGDLLEDIGYDRNYIINHLWRLPQSSFRTQYAYTNFGLTAAAEAVATKLNINWADLSQNSLYTPLGMTKTSSRHSVYMKRTNKADGHILNDKGQFIVSNKRNPDAQAPAGGVSSNINDMAKWMKLILSGGVHNNKQFINAKVLLAAASPQIISSHAYALDARASTYGYGFGNNVRPSGRVEISHSGAFALGASTNYTLVPSLELGIISLTNALPTGAPESINAMFLDYVEYGHLTQDWFKLYQPIMSALSKPIGKLLNSSPPINPAAARKLERYLGTYKSPYFGEASITKKNEELFLHLGPKKQSYKMQHWNKDIFAIYPATENAPQGSISQVSFEFKAGSMASRLSVEFLNNYGLGHFKRVK